jgi:hypothetical protein
VIFSYPFWNAILNWLCVCIYIYLFIPVLMLPLLYMGKFMVHWIISNVLLHNVTKLIVNKYFLKEITFPIIKNIIIIKYYLSKLSKI